MSLGMGGGLSGQWVRSRTTRDAELFERERRDRARRRRGHDWSVAARRRWWCAVGAVLVLAVVSGVVRG